ncbi:hypothetical protein [Chitinophaga sp.]|uniref:hypothetical protein n=1 Tax=Chitinophaga sp. TaxID=1869181 RepID=UPI002B97D332|nr:hypothetical protein [Chitinophaga sp.]HWV64364.1 hypothetical protein [Chitinophaga sp.]
MAKPIIFLKAPSSYSEWDRERLLEIADEIEKSFEYQYHVFLVASTGTDWQMEVFNAEQLRDIIIDELKRKLWEGN